jgi:hypothetical protein
MRRTFQPYLVSANEQTTSSGVTEHVRRQLRSERALRVP